MVRAFLIPLSNIYGHTGAILKQCSSYERERDSLQVWQKRKRQPTSLEAASHSSTIAGLGEIATSRFTYRGTLRTPTKVQLNYLNKTGQWSGATFPGLEDADLQQILESSTGGGNKSYCDTYALDPEKFTVSFHPSDTGVLGDVRLLLVPDVLNIRAELYKMNIYTGPTGCFKAHVDTPRGGKMFGSLVVCLPSQFTGGALVTRHNGQQVTYDWSSPGDGPIQSIRWAAFFSDVEHEILEVTEGHRVTLTYNLYYDEISMVSTMDVTNSPFYYNLKAALDHPHFVRDGGVLGFACQHFYVFEDLAKVREALKNVSRVQHVLKGSDHTVMVAARSLGLNVEVKPIHVTPWVNYLVGDEFKFYYYGGEICRDDGDTWKSYLEEDPLNGFRDASHITWCQELKHWHARCCSK